MKGQPKPRPARRFSSEFKQAAVDRMRRGTSVSALSRELDVRRKILYAWKERSQQGLPFRSLGRPRLTAEDVQRTQQKREASAQLRIAELEQKVGQQQLLIDFFEQALRRTGALCQLNSESGGTNSTRSSKPRRDSKAD